jgi:nucleoside-triphosphatase THEP1
VVKSVKLVTAGRGEGKTTYVRRYAAARAAGGHTVGGIVSPAVFEGGRRLGYDLLDLRAGSRRPLARKAGPGDGPPTVGIYRFDAAVVADGNAAVMRAVRDGVSIVVIDEVGRLEFQGAGWAPALEFVLGEGGDDLELIITVRSLFVDELPVHFPSAAWGEAGRISPPWPEESTD